METLGPPGATTGLSVNSSVKADFLSSFDVSELLKAVHHLSKSTQLGLSVGIVLLAFLLHRAISLGVVRRATSLEKARTLIIRVRTTISLAAALCLVTLWSTELKSAMLTLAALGAAAILAFKEILACWLGSIYRAAASSFDVGDIVEINGVKGEVVDVGAISFTIMELGSTFQVTGRAVEIPNSLLFLHGVRNLSQPGAYVVHFTRVPVPSEDDVLQHRSALLDAANAACESFQASAERSLQNARMQLLANTPSATPSVAIEPRDAKTVDLVLRYPCPRDSRVRTEQDILTRYYAGLKERRATGASAKPPAS